VSQESIVTWIFTKPLRSFTRKNSGLTAQSGTDQVIRFNGRPPSTGTAPNNRSLRRHVLGSKIAAARPLVIPLLGAVGLLLRLPPGLVEIFVYRGLPGGHIFRQQLVETLFRDN
jgi:hypothetical protein